LAIWISEFAAMIWMSGLAHAAGGGTDQPLLAPVGTDGGRQYARDGRNRSVETELAEHGEACQCVRWDRADRRHQPKRNRQVVVAAFLGKIGGCKIHRDASCRQRKPRGDQRGADPLARFRDGLVGKPHDMKRRQPRGDLHLHVDGARLDPLKGHGGNPLNHAALRPSFLNQG
jgi:hypothetical protein